MNITKGAPNFTSSSNTKKTFADLPREIRDKVYKHMLTDSKTIDAAEIPLDYGQPEDLGTLRATLHACRTSPQFAAEAFEVFFEINIFRIAADQGLGFLHRPLCYVKGEGFISTVTLVKEVEILLIIGEQVGEYESHKHYKLRDWFHNLLACSVLCRVTVKVGLDPDSKYSWNNVPKDIIPSERESKWLDAILNVTTGVYQELKGKLRQELKFKTNNLCIGARIKAWEQKCMGKTAVEVTGAVVLGEEGPSEGASF